MLIHPRRPLVADPKIWVCGGRDNGFVVGRISINMERLAAEKGGRSSLFPRSPNLPPVTSLLLQFAYLTPTILPRDPLFTSVSILPLSFPPPSRNSLTSGQLEQMAISIETKLIAATAVIAYFVGKRWLSYRGSDVRRLKKPVSCPVPSLGADADAFVSSFC